MEAAAFSIDIHNAGGAWNKALIDNAARPPARWCSPARAARIAERRTVPAAEARARRHACRRRAMPGGRCCSKAGSTGGRCRSRRRTWISSKRGTPPRATSRWRSACRRCCSAFRATTPTRTTAKPTRVLAPDRAAAGAESRARDRSVDRRSLAVKPGRPPCSVDLEAVPALAIEREALWARIAAADFLRTDEKRRLAGVEAPERAQ